MTNWEKLSSKGLMELIASILHTVSDPSFCNTCPAVDYCNDEATPVLGCKTSFLTWANMETVPDGPYCADCDHVSYDRNHNSDFCMKYKFHLGNDGNGTMRCMACINREESYDA